MNSASNGKCSVCRAPVREGMIVKSLDDDGSQHVFDRLCRRCLEAEKVFARRVSLFSGRFLVEELVNEGPALPRPLPVRLPAAA